MDGQNARGARGVLRRLGSTGEPIGRPAAGRESDEDRSDGEPLELAEKESDAPLLTTDKGIPYQQDLTRFDLALVLLRARSNAYEDLAPLMGEAIAPLASTAPGTATHVTAAPR